MKGKVAVAGVLMLTACIIGTGCAKVEEKDPPKPAKQEVQIEYP